jgi:hypothetical protein
MHKEEVGATTDIKITRLTYVIRQLRSMAEQANKLRGPSWEHGARSATTLLDAATFLESLYFEHKITSSREPTQEEGEACCEPKYENRIQECHIPIGNHHGHRCKCDKWVWGGPTVCQRCTDTDAVKLLKEQTERIIKFLELLTHGGTIVSSATLSTEEIAVAQFNDRMFVAPNGYGYAYIPKSKF